ncbi:MAG: RNA-binding protein [Blastopirellula sp.]|nr:MAG: RNA-binding protein [Blastopirellula sp.]
MIAIFIAAIIGGGLYAYSFRTPKPPEPKPRDLANVKNRTETEIEIPTVLFTDITQDAGIQFVHQNGFSKEKLLPETMGGGCAFLDYDNDGDQDILLTNSTYWSWDEENKNKPKPTMSLYQNDGTGKFVDVTKDSGLEIECYGMGVAVGDYDNDGLVDIYITTVGENLLFHNQGNGKFVEQAKQAGVAGDIKAWGTSCGWFDYDNDGDLDLYVGNYLDWTREYDTSQNFQLTGGERAYGRPMNFAGTLPYLFQNDGKGNFTEVAEAAGLQIKDPQTDAPMSKALGVAFADIDNDGWIDIIMANDTVQNFLFHNQQDGTFIEKGNLAGLAFDESGKARGAMGIDVAAFRNENTLGVAIGNFANEMTALYVANDNDLLFVDEAMSTGLGPVSRLKLTFGVFYFDYDFDGQLDLFTANGHLEKEINRVQESQRYHQSPQLFRNCGAKSETEFLLLNEQQCGTDLIKPMVARGACFADIDGDADLDILIASVGEPPRLLRNDLNSNSHWIKFKLNGTTSNRDAIGAVIEVQTATRTLRRQVMPTRSYLSQVELPVTFGLGEEEAITSVKIHWPGGETQELESLPIDQLHNIKQP